MKYLALLILSVVVFSGCTTSVRVSEHSVACLYEKVSTEKALRGIEKKYNIDCADTFDSAGNLIVKSGELICGYSSGGATSTLTCFDGTCSTATSTMGMDYDYEGEEPIKCQEVLRTPHWKKLLPKAESNQIWIRL